MSSTNMVQGSWSCTWGLSGHHLLADNPYGSLSLSPHYSWKADLQWWCILRELQIVWHLKPRWMLIAISIIRQLFLTMKMKMSSSCWGANGFFWNPLPACGGTSCNLLGNRGPDRVSESGGPRCSSSPDSWRLHSGDQDLRLAKTQLPRQHLGFRTTQLPSSFLWAVSSSFIGHGYIICRVQRCPWDS